MGNECCCERSGLRPPEDAHNFDNEGAYHGVNRYYASDAAYASGVNHAWGYSGDAHGHTHWPQDGGCGNGVSGDHSGVMSLDDMNREVFHLGTGQRPPELYQAKHLPSVQHSLPSPDQFVSGSDVNHDDVTSHQAKISSNGNDSHHKRILSRRHQMPPEPEFQEAALQALDDSDFSFIEESLPSDLPEPSGRPSSNPAGHRSDLPHSSAGETSVGRQTSQTSQPHRSDTARQSSSSHHHAVPELSRGGGSGGGGGPQRAITPGDPIIVGVADVQEQLDRYFHTSRTLIDLEQHVRVSGGKRAARRSTSRQGRGGSQQGRLLAHDAPSRQAEAHTREEEAGHVGSSSRNGHPRARDADDQRRVSHSGHSQWTHEHDEQHDRRASSRQATYGGQRSSPHAHAHELDERDGRSASQHTVCPVREATAARDRQRNGSRHDDVGDNDVVEYGSRRSSSRPTQQHVCDSDYAYAGGGAGGCSREQTQQHYTHGGEERCCGSGRPSRAKQTRQYPHDGEGRDYSYGGGGRASRGEQARQHPHDREERDYSYGGGRASPGEQRAREGDECSGRLSVLSSDDVLPRTVVHQEDFLP